MTGLEAIDALCYASYKANREAKPEIPWHEWRVIFHGATEGYEARYQRERDQRFEDLLRAAAASLSATSTHLIQQCEQQREDMAVYYDCLADHAEPGDEAE